MIDAMLESLTRVWHTFLARLLFFTPRLLAALVVVLAGWVLGMVLRGILRRVLKGGAFDAWVDRIGLAFLLRRSGWPIPTAAFLAGVVYWGILATSVMFSLMAFEMPLLDRMATEFFLFLPRLGVALVILGLGLMFSGFLSRAVLLASVNAEFPVPRVVAGAVRLLVIMLSSAMALEQVGIATTMVGVAFGIAFGGVMLGLALAFGIGGRDLARDLLRKGSRGESEREDLGRHM